MIVEIDSLCPLLFAVGLTPRTSAPRSKSIAPGVLKTGSASSSTNRCFHLSFKGVGLKADWRWLYAAQWLVLEISFSTFKISNPEIYRASFGVVHIDSLCPLVFAVGRRLSRCAKHSVMNNVENAESSNALACMLEPSEPSIWTLDTISRTCLCCTVRDTLAVTMSIDSPERGPTWAALRFSLLELMCSQKWCGWWHFYHFGETDIP